MDITLAIEHALDGNAILFLGSGFSLGAKNIRGNSFMTGWQLAKHLALLAKIEEDAPMEDAADEFIQQFGIDGLIKELYEEFKSREITRAHEIIAQIPWKTIYTTNYDDVMEAAYAKMKKPLQPITFSDNLRDMTVSSCIHINGFINRLNRKTIGGEFKLTDS